MFPANEQEEASVRVKFGVFSLYKQNTVICCCELLGRQNSRAVLVMKHRLLSYGRCEYKIPQSITKRANVGLFVHNVLLGRNLRKLVAK